ncbi:PTS Man IIB [Lactobacillus kimbladii]|uniref:PTS Man IIB n=1 Tax=Lactobacillus kimbladii TaxID=1218506 RepID=A0A0F4LIE6_9LACO|nr:MULTISPECIES: PTS sugar transporter subunit IIB [Lactobacillus]KJY57336.1 PTS Man IIB [Lactobacillus kimbladii]RMC53256.1 PTS mannose/fructose/sorbose transporter subunit IIB [Lactobacillus sp. ESL0261]
MIQMVRVDYRLLHGQVAVSWTSSLGINAILLVSETLKKDKIRMQSIALAKPSGVKVVAKSTSEAIAQLKSGKTDKYSLLIICETVKIAEKIIESTGFNSLNLGNVPFRKGTMKFSNSVYLNDEETKILKDMKNKGTNIFSQMIPDDTKHQFK